MAGVAGLRKALRLSLVKRGESALVVITGNGLKDIQTARAAAGNEVRIEPRLEAVKAALASTPGKASSGI